MIIDLNPAYGSEEELELGVTPPLLGTINDPSQMRERSIPPYPHPMLFHNGLSHSASPSAAKGSLVSLLTCFSSLIAGNWIFVEETDLPASPSLFLQGGNSVVIVPKVPFSPLSCHGYKRNLKSPLPLFLTFQAHFATVNEKDEFETRDRLPGRP